MPTYAQLRRTHAEYDAALFAELEDLYEGGYQILSRASKYLPQLAGEPTPQYRDRCRAASFMPYMGQIVDQLTAWLFADGLTVQAASDAEDSTTPGEVPDPDFYSLFASDADLSGIGFSDVVRAIVPEALIKRRTLIGADFPAVDDATRAGITTEADENDTGATRAYLYEVPLESAINWDRNADGTFRWLVINRVSQPQAGPLDSNETIVEEWKVWTMTADGTAHWDLYRLAYTEKTKPKPTTPVPLVDGGDTTFGAIPILEMELPKGLWVGNKIGPMVREHFQRRATLVAAENKSLFEVPVIQLGSEIGEAQGALPSATQQNPNRGQDPVGQFQARGFMPIGAGDKFEFVGPSGKAYEIVDKQLEGLKDEIFRVVHLMAASVSNNKSAALGRSGLAKQQDKHDTAIVLSAIASYVRRFAVRIYTLVSEARGEDVAWRTHGMDDFGEVDRQQLLAEAVQVDMVSIPSQTFKAGYKTRLAMQLDPDMSPETQAIVRDEIVEGVAHETDMRQMAAEAALSPEPEPDADDANADGPPARGGSGGAAPGRAPGSKKPGK